eukprot:3630545-Prymnesium_polylepis.1
MLLLLLRLQLQHLLRVPSIAAAGRTRLAAQLGRNALAAHAGRQLLRVFEAEPRVVLLHGNA